MTCILLQFLCVGVWVSLSWIFCIVSHKTLKFWLGCGLIWDLTGEGLSIGYVDHFGCWQNSDP